MMCTPDSLATLLMQSDKGSMLPCLVQVEPWQQLQEGEHQLRVTCQSLPVCYCAVTWHTQGAPQPVAAAAGGARLGQSCRS